MPIKVELKEGYLPTDQIYTVFLGDEETWKSLVEDNLSCREEKDINGDDYRVLNEEELLALADFVWNNCKDRFKGREVVDYHFDVNGKNVGFGSRGWWAFLMRVADLKRVSKE
jgi:hypothetical protein